MTWSSTAGNLEQPPPLPRGAFGEEAQQAGLMGAAAWTGLAYVSFFSMLIGFVFWYRGLAQGGTAAVGQLQLLQPFMGLGLAALLLQEAVSWMMLVMTLGAVACVAGSKKFAT